MKAKLRGWRDGLEHKIVEWSPPSSTGGMRNPHLWIIIFLMAFGIFHYYVDQTTLIIVPPFNHPLFSTTHDLHRTLFLIPIVYAAVVFRIRGSVIASFVFLCVVLPRAVLFSPNPQPLLRALVFVYFELVISLLIAVGLNRVEREETARRELARAYRELRETQEQLIQADRLTALGQLAASIAHEVNNPIAGILVYTQLIARKLAADTLSKEKALDYLSRMESELTRSGRLVRNLLDFARQTKPAFELVNLNDVVDQALSLVDHTAELQHVEVVKDFSPTVTEITADAHQLQQVFTNLMLNAIQAMPEGGKLTVRTSTDGAEEAKVAVQDTGCGISPENLRKLFTPFFTTKREVKGVGLGLAVSYGIIQRHGGKIDVQSEEGKGSTFTVILPLKQAEYKGFPDYGDLY